MAALFRKRQFKPWISSIIISKTRNFKPKVVKVLCRRSQSVPGCRVMLVSDGELSISAVFSDEAIHNALSDMDIESNNSNWNTALLILQEFTLELKVQPDMDMGDYVLYVARFNIWDLQPGYQAKYDLKYCMKDEQISERMKEEMKEKKESAACQSEFSMSSSIALSQLLEEMANPSTSLSESEDSPEQGKACTTDLTDKRSMTDCTCGPVTDSLVEKLLQPFTVEEFLIPAAQANVLDNIEEWKTDYQPSPSEDSGESPADGQFDVCALNTLLQDHAVVLTDRNSEKTGSKEAKTDVEYLGISFLSSPESKEEKASAHRKSPGPVCALFKHMYADSQSQGASSQWQEEVESVRFSFEEDSCALSSQESPEEACRPICKESQIENVTKEHVESKSTSLGENSNKHVVKNCPSKNPPQMCMKSKKVTSVETKDVESGKESPKENSDLLYSRTSPELDWSKEVNVCKPASEESGKFVFSKVSSREICAVNSDCLDIGPPAALSTQIDDTVDDSSRLLQGSVKGGVEELLDNTEQNENVAVVVNETNDVKHQSSSHNSDQTEYSDLVSPVLICLESSKKDTQPPLVINPKTKVKTESFNQTHETIYASEQNSDQSSSDADRSAMHSYYSQDYMSPDRNWNNVMIRLSKKKKQLEALKYITERISGVVNESKKSDGSEKLDSHDNSLNIRIETSKENGHSDSAIIGKISENLESMDHEESGKSVEIQDDEITKEADDIAETCSENCEGVERTEEETASFCYVVQDAECDSESANKLTEINEEENTQLDTVETTETGYPVSSLSLRETLEECHSCLLPSDTVLNETNLEEIDRFHCKRIAEHTDLGAMEECDQNSDQTDLEEIDKAYQRCINAGDEKKTILSSEVNTSNQEDKTGNPLAPEYFDTESGSRKRSERLYAKVISCREKDKQIYGKKNMIETVTPVLQNIGNKSDVKKNKINAESEIEKHKGPVLVDCGSTFCVETVLDINIADAESTELTSEVDVDQNAKELPGENLIAKLYDESSRDATKSTNGLTINDLDGKKNLENKKAGTLKSVESCCEVPEYRKLVDFTKVRSGKVTRQRTVPVCEDSNSILNKKVCNNFKEIESRVSSQKSNDSGNFPLAKELNGCDKRGALPSNNRLPAVKMLLRKIFKNKCSVLPDGTGRYKTRSKMVNNSKSESVGSKVAKNDELTAKVTESKHGTEIVIDSDTDSSDTATVTKSESITEIVSDSSTKDSSTVKISGIMNDEKMTENQTEALSDGKKRPERIVLSDFVTSESRKEIIMLRTDCEPEMKTTVVEGKADETDEHQHENGNSAAVTRIKLKKLFAPFTFEDQFKTWLRKDETENEENMHTSQSELDSHTESGMQCVIVTKDEEKANCKESSLLENVHLDTSENTKLTDTHDKSESDIFNTYKDLQNEVSMEQCDKGVISCPIQSTQAFDVCPYPQTQEFSPKMSDTQLQTSLNESIVAHNVSSHVDKSPEGLDTVSCSEERNSSDAKVTENTSKLQNHLIKDSQGNDKSQGNPVKDSVCEKRKDSADKFLSVSVDTVQAHEKENVCGSVSNVGNKVSSLHLLVNVMSPNLQVEGSELRVSKPVHNSSESDSLLKSASEKQFTKLIGKSDHIKISDDFWAITKPEKLDLKVKPVQRKDIKRKRKINDNIVDETNNRKKQKCIEKESLGGLNNRNTQKINQEVEAVELKVVKEGKGISESLNDSVCLDKTEKPIKTYEPRKIFIDGNNFGNKVFWQNFVEAPYTASKQISSETKNKSCVEKTNKRKLSLDSSQGSQGKDSSYRHCKTSKDADNGKVYRSSESLFSEENETLDTNSDSVSLMKCKKTETKELGINSSLRKVTYQVKHKVTVNTHNKQEDKHIGNGELRYFKADSLTRFYRAKDKTDTQSKGRVVSTEHSARKETPQLHRMNKENSSAKTSLPVCRASQNEQNRNSNKVEVNKRALVNTEQDSSRRSQERITEKSASFRNKVLSNSKSKMTCVDKQLFIQDWLMKHKKIGEEESSSLEPSPPGICSPENSLPSYQTGGITREHNVNHVGQTGENTSMLNDEEQEGEDKSSDNTSTSETCSSSDSEDPDKPMSAAAKYLLKLKRARKERKTREVLAFKSGVRTQAQDYLKSCGRI